MDLYIDERAAFNDSLALVLVPPNQCSAGCSTSCRSCYSGGGSGGNQCATNHPGTGSCGGKCGGCHAIVDQVAGPAC